ncbi:MAG: rRNA adenine N-6-methyltransferase family protein [Caulobacterales bacterium]
MSDGFDPQRLMRFVLEMRQAGITDAKALSALERTPRDHYAPAAMSQLAYDDSGLPLPHGQTMTKPSIVGRVIAALDVQPGDNILEIGTGSGFQAAALATMARRVTTLDLWLDLVTDARARFGTARIMNVSAHLADGAGGYGEHAPYDRIVLNVGVETIPETLAVQLVSGGVIVAPVGDQNTQRLVRIRNGLRDDLGPIKFSMIEKGVEA